MNSLEILKILIALPSFVNTNDNESKAGAWIYEYLRENSNLTVKKQYCTQNRFNVVASNGKKVDILVTGHIDTVQPSSGWSKNPFAPTIVGNKLYGLGSSDMKSGVAAMLNATSSPRLKPNIMFLFYIDEEYDFTGMKKFIQEYKNKIKPKLIISLDGEDLKIERCCRGLIELTVKTRGLAGHAANPLSGINAILKSYQLIDQLSGWLKTYKTKELGASTLNISFIKGGSLLERNQKEVKLGKEGNIIPDYCEYVVEIRVADSKLNAKLVSNFIESNNVKLGLKTEDIEIRHDLGSWITSKTELEEIINSTPGIKYTDPSKSGYIDIQMLWEVFDKVPTFSVGCGEKGMAHKPDEYVDLVKFNKLITIVSRLLTH